MNVLSLYDKGNKKLAIIQPNYIPWKGYFDIINSADEFIFLDDVQYTKNDWRNRNLIKTPAGLKWLTIPVQPRSLDELICDVNISDAGWGKKHWNSLVHNYSKAECFKMYRDRFEYLYLGNTEKLINQVAQLFIREIMNILNIQTRVSSSSDYRVEGNKTKKILNLCKAVNASIYITGPSAKDYLEEEMLRNEGIQVEWFSYDAYPEYVQLYPPFEHKVSILDLLFHKGPQATQYMKSFIKK